MSVVDRTFNDIREGFKGNRPFISTQLAKLDQHIYGVKQATTYLVGGDTGTGKSSLSRSMFIHNPYEQYLALNNTDLFDVMLVDFSLEISAELNLATALSRRIFLDTKLVLPIGKLFSWSHDKLEASELEVVEKYKDYFNEFGKKHLVVDRDITPTYFHDFMMELAKKVGKFKHEGRYISQCGEYTLHNPNLHVIVVLDTINLAEQEPNYNNAKAVIDRISKTIIKFRNKCRFTFVIVQQFNSDIASTDRARFGINSPTLKDFMDSSGPTKDANVVLALYSPMRYMSGDQTHFKNYNIERLKSWFISIHVLKNRYGASAKYVPCKFDGAVGVFTQLPDTMTEQDYIDATRH